MVTVKHEVDSIRRPQTFFSEACGFDTDLVSDRGNTIMQGDANWRPLRVIRADSEGETF